jgi:hypothetical protein
MELKNVDEHMRDIDKDMTRGGWLVLCSVISVITGMVISLVHMMSVVSLAREIAPEYTWLEVFIIELDVAFWLGVMATVVIFVSCVLLLWLSDSASDHLQTRGN